MKIVESYAKGIAGRSPVGFTRPEVHSSSYTLGTLSRLLLAVCSRKCSITPIMKRWLAPQCHSDRVRENACNNSKIRKKSFFGFSKNVKNVKNVRIIFHCCLMFIVPLHCCQNLTSFTLDVQQWLRMDHTRGSGN